MTAPYISETFAPQADADRPIWTDAKNFIGFGVRFGLRANSPQIFQAALAEIPLGWQEISDSQADVVYSLYVTEPTQARAGQPEHLLYAGTELLARDFADVSLIQEFTKHARLTTTLYARERLFVHAGVVGWQGQAILIPGRSHSGKTTLVKALVEAGAVYYSDEFAVLDRAGCTHPYALPLSIRAADGTVTNTPVTALGGQVGTEPLPVTLVVLTRYSDGALWQPQALSPALAMLALMENTVAARRAPEFSMPVLRATAMRARTRQSTRGEAAHIVPDILALVGER